MTGQGDMRITPLTPRGGHSPKRGGLQTLKKYKIVFDRAQSGTYKALPQKSRNKGIAKTAHKAEKYFKIMFDSLATGKYKASHASRKRLRREAPKTLKKKKKYFLFL